MTVAKHTYRYRYASAAQDVIERYAAGELTGAEGMFCYLAWQNTHSPLQVPTKFCYNSTLDEHEHEHEHEHEARLSAATRMPHDCPSEGPTVKGHSFCYCYNNETVRRSGGRVAAPTLSEQVDVGVCAHGNSTAGGDNMDRHTYNAMARVMDQGMGNVTGIIERLGLWSQTLLIFSADNVTRTPTPPPRCCQACLMRIGACAGRSDQRSARRWK